MLSETFLGEKREGWILLGPKSADTKYSVSQKNVLSTHWTMGCDLTWDQLTKYSCLTTVNII